MNQVFGSKNIDERRNYFLEEIESRKCKTVCGLFISKSNEHFLILASAITGCISISAFASLFGIPIRIAIFLQ